MPWACPHLNQILMTFPRPCPPPPSPKDSVSGHEPRYLQVRRILGQENGDHRLLGACRVTCIRLGSEDWKMFGKSCRSPPPFQPLSFQSTRTFRPPPRTAVSPGCLVPLCPLTVRVLAATLPLRACGRAR